MGIKASVILPVFNGQPYLRYQLRALSEQVCSFPWEMIVVDNGSTDDSAAVAKSFDGRLPRLRVLTEPRRGKSNALNAGMAAAVGEYLVFVDADDEVDAHYLAQMAHGLEDADLVGARQDLSVVNAKWAQYSPPPADSLAVPEGFLPFIPGGTLGVRADIARRLSGFSAQVGIGDDVDFSWRAQMEGASVRFLPDAVLHVRRPADAWGGFQKGRGYGRSHVMLYKRYRSAGLSRRSREEVVGDVRTVLREVKHHQPHWTWRSGYKAGFLLGNIEESVRQRTFYL